MNKIAKVFFILCLIFNFLSLGAKPIKKPVPKRKQALKILSAKAQLQDYYKHGILFFAKGNSPEWSFEVDQTNKIIRLLSSTGMIFTAAFEEPFQNFNSLELHYNLKTVLGHLKVVMVPKATKLKNDSLSYTYQVIVDVKYEQDPEYQHYEGVGMFVPDFAYEGKWYLESLNHQIFNQDKKNPVYIQIELSLGKYSGFNSCNWVGGKFICEGKRKQFLTEFSTLKACDGMVEADFTRAILGAVFIEIKNNKLVLSDSKSELAVFVR